jgi:hypothetical protein
VTVDGVAHLVAVRGMDMWWLFAGLVVGLICVGAIVAFAVRRRDHRGSGEPSRDLTDLHEGGGGTQLRYR